VPAGDVDGQRGVHLVGLLLSLFRVGDGVRAGRGGIGIGVEAGGRGRGGRVGAVGCEGVRGACDEGAVLGASHGVESRQSGTAGAQPTSRSRSRWLAVACASVALSHCLGPREPPGTLASPAPACSRPIASNYPSISIFITRHGRRLTAPTPDAVGRDVGRRTPQPATLLSLHGNVTHLTHCSRPT
jgi:hypothetical protein